MHVVIMLADPAPDDVYLGSCMVKDQAAFRANAPIATFGFEWSANVEINGAFGTVFFNHVTSFISPAKPRLPKSLGRSKELFSLAHISLV
jgi:hypothetical protein